MNMFAEVVSKKGDFLLSNIKIPLNSAKFCRVPDISSYCFCEDIVLALGRCFFPGETKPVRSFLLKMSSRF